jgi:rRNA biogenesis protein RRP5
MFREGDKVKVVILSINLEKRKIGFGLKPSYFDAEDFEMGSDDAPDNEGEAEPVSQETNRSEEGDDDDAVEEEDDDDNEESGDEDQEDVRIYIYSYRV